MKLLERIKICINILNHKEDKLTDAQKRLVESYMSYNSTSLIKKCIRCDKPVQKGKDYCSLSCSDAFYFC